MLDSMSESGLRSETLNWSDLGMSELPTGTVTLLLADIEGSTGLWEADSGIMAAAVAELDRIVGELVSAHRGVRPTEQGEGDSFVVAFTRASDAVAFALDLQSSPLEPIRLRIGIHTGEVQLRDEGNYIGQTINKTARLRDLAHGGQTVLSSVAEAVVGDRLPAGAWLVDQGAHQLRDLPRPERVLQLCHPQLRTEFPPLRAAKVAHLQRLPMQLTNFIGRQDELTELHQLLDVNRVVTLTGAGGMGKTRLAVEVAARSADLFGNEVWYADLTPITEPGLVAMTVARVLGLADQPGVSTMDALRQLIGERRMLLVLDNCEHLIDAIAAVVVGLASTCPRLTILATSREPVGIAGEATWRVPSLPLAGEAIELFTDRARLACSDFVVTEQHVSTVMEICRRLDGMPLAIELAAARVRTLSLADIVDGLHDRFRLLTGGARTAVRRQQTLRASVEWSHALLTEPERALFRRLAVFSGGFVLDAAQSVCTGSQLERFQILDQLTLLVDKSLVVIESHWGRTRYRLLETVRQYAQEKLIESGEANEVRCRHRDHYVSFAALLDTPAPTGHEATMDRVGLEFDNLRVAYAWCRENSETDVALKLASSLQSLWLRLGRMHEGLAWFDSVFSTEQGWSDEVDASVRARALANSAILRIWAAGNATNEDAGKALTIARELGDPALLARALAVRAVIAAHCDEASQHYFAEAIALTRTLGDRWTLTEILGWQVNLAFMGGDANAVAVSAGEGCDVADAIGDLVVSHQCRTWLGWARMVAGEMSQAVGLLRDVRARADSHGDQIWSVVSAHYEGQALARRGDTASAQVLLDEVMPAILELGGMWSGNAWGVRALVALAGGDVGAAAAASAKAMTQLASAPVHRQMYLFTAAEVALASGDPAAARRWADEALSMAKGWYLVQSMTTSARIALRLGEWARAERDAHEALALAAEVGAHLGVPDILECLAGSAAKDGSLDEAARLLGAADAARRRMTAARFAVHQVDYDATVATIRSALGDDAFGRAWDDGAELSIDEAVAYVRRGRGERKRPSVGWAALTPTEHDVVRLVSEGLANKDIASRLFVSPRTVETHITHIYTKLAIKSRVQLVQEAARRG
jgi:predicted ATPase/class 3 adenylate cyclase/DNA-binding CsgD family transcriptional regulator